MIKELDDKYHFLINEAEKNNDIELVAILKREYESQRRNLSNDTSDESYMGDFYLKTL